ncbi:MAG: redoxin domain-containing protein [Betaproteobacteria bacterium]|nr:MAG: redoxin domain-containing protein [Betaproteobacteria bacterium]
MAGFGRERNALEAIGAKVVAASVDPLDKAKEVAAEVGFPIAYGATREQADAIGAWWEERRGIVQPAEFIIGRDGKVVASTYSSGPIGRIDAADVVKLISFYEAQAQKK